MFSFLMIEEMRVKSNYMLILKKKKRQGKISGSIIYNFFFLLITNHLYIVKFWGFQLFFEV